MEALAPGKAVARGESADADMSDIDDRHLYTGTWV
jgi:hypothetical protein